MFSLKAFTINSKKSCAAFLSVIFYFLHEFVEYFQRKRLSGILIQYISSEISIQYFLTLNIN